MTDLIPAPTRLFFREQALEVGCAARDVIDLLAAEAADLLGMPEAAEAICLSALRREGEDCTYVGKGLAVPHARIPQLEHPAVYVARCPEGLPWPDEKAHVVTLLIVPEERPELHLQLLSRLVRARLKGLL